MKKILIVHYGPIDKYPPTFNFVRYFHSVIPENVNIAVLSSKRKYTLKIDGLLNVKNLSINDKSYSSSLIINILFNLRLLWLTLFKGYTTILYYETFSSLVPSILNISPLRSVYKIAAHFHEYVSNSEIANASSAYKVVNSLERRALKHCSWISHTNEDRLNLFFKDNPEIDFKSTHLLPNYPPRVWKKVRKRKIGKDYSDKIRLVYVGALNDETMFVSELVSIINNVSNKLELTLYSDNFSEHTKSVFDTICSESVIFKGPVNYDQLPEILPQFDVGLVLYRGHIPNYIYNVPNKVFEYLACGLPVLFPKKMQSVYSYTEYISNKYIYPVDFNTLTFEEILKWVSNVNTVSLWEDYNLYCDDVYEVLSKELLI